MDLLWNVFETGINLFESCVTIHFICAFLRHDLTKRKGKLIYVSGVLSDFLIVTILNYFSDYEGLLGIIYILIYFIFALIFIESTVPRKLLAACLCNIVLVFANAVVANIVSVLFKSDLSLVYEQETIERVSMIICVQILLVCIYDLILKYTIVSLKPSEWKLILSVLSVSFISIVLLHITFLNINISIFYAKLMMTAEFGIIMLNIVCFYMTYALSRSNSEAEKLRIRQQQEEYRLQYAENVKRQYEEMRKMKHDMKQNLAVIAMLYNEQKYYEAQEYANKAADRLSSFDIIIDVNNDFLNAILNSKLSVARQHGIKILCTVSSDISGVEDTDLCSLLGNMIDNAIEATDKCDDKAIEVNVSSDNNKILVIIANTIMTSVLQVNKNLLSTKNDNGTHGYGVKTIQSIANKYNGTVRFYEENKMFYCQVLMYKSLSNLPESCQNSLNY